MNTNRKEKGKSASRIFLSYVAADRAYARKLRGLLSQRPNLSVFTTETLSAGEDWQSRLKDELSQSDILIVLLSSNSVNSPWVLQELGAAWALNKPIVPVLIHPEVSFKMPMMLRELQSVEIKDLETPEVIDQILEGYEKAGDFT